MAGVKKFADADAVLTELDQITNVIAGQVAKAATTETAQVDELTRLRAQVAAGSPVTGEQFDGLIARATASRDAMKTIEANLRPLAADVTNPAPTPTPIPGEGGPAEEEG